MRRTERRRIASRQLWLTGRTIEDASAYVGGGAPKLGLRVLRRRGWRWVWRHVR